MAPPPNIEIISHTSVNMTTWQCVLVRAIDSKSCTGHAFHPLDCVSVAQHWSFSLAIHTLQKLWLGRLMKQNGQWWCTDTPFEGCGLQDYGRDWLYCNHSVITEECLAWLGNTTIHTVMYSPILWIWTVMATFCHGNNSISGHGENSL